MLLGGYILPEAEARQFTNLNSDRYNIVDVASKLDDMIRNVEIISTYLKLDRHYNSCVKDSM